MGKSMRRAAVLLLIVALLITSAAAELIWPEAMTPAQIALQSYIGQVNSNLMLCGEEQINTTFEMYPTFASLGATSDPSQLMPEGVELYFTMYETSMNKLELLVNDPEKFRNAAAACLQAASPETLTIEAALKYVQPYVQRVITEPQNSFEEAVTELNGTSPRAYFAYYPDMFHDGVNWLQMTVIFPLAGANDGFAGTTPPPEGNATYEGYIDYMPEDDYMHFEVFATATPEPNSPAGEAYN